MFIEKIEDSLKSVPEYTSFPKTFENYSWYKPLITGVIIAIIFTVLTALLIGLGAQNTGIGSMYKLSEVFTGGYDSLNAYSIFGIISIFSIALIIPSIYIASKIVRDRPFSSYSTSRKKWNWNIYFKTLGISLIILLIISIIDSLIHGFTFNNHFTIVTFILCLIVTPLQCIGEEYMLRGYVMQTIGSWFGIPVLAIILQAVLFASLHPYNILGVTSTLAVGITFGIITYYTKGLEMSSGIHSANNLFSFYLSGFGISKIVTNVDIISFGMNILFLIISTLLIFYIANKQGWFKDSDV